MRRWFRAVPRVETHTTPQIVIEHVDGISIVVLPGVFNGIRHHTGAFLASTLTADVLGPNSTVLELGTGSGVCAVFAGRHAARVVAVDINPAAVRCASINVLAHHLERVVETREGDLFGPVTGERFDLVLFNPPYFHGVPKDAADHALRSVDAFARFLRELPAHLTPRGRALVVLSPETDIEQEIHHATHLTVSTFRTRVVLGKLLIVFEVWPK